MLRLLMRPGGFALVTSEVTVEIRVSEKLLGFFRRQPAEAPFIVDTEESVGAESLEADDRLEAPPEVVKRAAQLQALAMDKNAEENERTNAWAQFGKLWKKYKLPSNVGF